MSSECTFFKVICLPYLGLEIATPASSVCFSSGVPRMVSGNASPVTRVLVPLKDVRHVWYRERVRDLELEVKSNQVPLLFELDRNALCTRHSDTPVWNM